MGKLYLSLICKENLENMRVSITAYQITYVGELKNIFLLGH